MSAITITLPDDQQAFVEEEIASGKYQSHSDYFAALVLDPQLRANQDEIDALLDEAENETTEPIPDSPQLWADLREDLEQFIRLEGLK